MVRAASAPDEAVHARREAAGPRGKEVEKPSVICYFRVASTRKPERMTAERQGPGERGRVLPLRPRRPLAGNDNRPPEAAPHANRSAIGDLSRFERKSESQDDYRHRMMVNVLAFFLVILLVIAGVWLTTKLAQMRKDQDCVLTGRRGCTAVDVPVRSRW
jgi:hypothetical protein